MSSIPQLMPSSRIPGGPALDLQARAGAAVGPALVRRVNQLYHDLTQDVFDREHQYRHRVESVLWREVAGQFAASHGTRPGRTIVDLACGTGFVTRILAGAMRPGDRLLAVDISPQALHTTARKCNGHRIGLSLADATSLPLPAGSVELFAINAALHHMPDPAAVLSEVDRVLCPGGRFVLGFEPNLHHFSSLMAALARGIDRLAWYASPRQNVRRFATRVFGRAPACDHDTIVCRTINDRIMDEGLSLAPLERDAILDLVDPHARGADLHGGFNALELIRSSFPDYRVVRLVTSDYLGEAIRRFPTMRALCDAALRAVLPGHGALFSMIMEKPSVAGGRV